MDIFLRSMAIFLEVLLLAVIAYAVLNGVRLTIFDLGLGAKYRNAIAMLLLTIGAIILIFFIAHLTAFYPTI